MKHRVSVPALVLSLLAVAFPDRTAIAQRKPERASDPVAVTPGRDPRQPVDAG